MRPAMSYGELTSLTDEEVEAIRFLTIYIFIEVEGNLSKVRLTDTVSVIKILTKEGLAKVADKLMMHLVNSGMKRYNIYMDPEISDFEFYAR